MSTTRPVQTEAPAGEMPAVPLTVEGYSTLHQMMRFRWSAWRSLRAPERKEIVGEAIPVMAGMEKNTRGQSAFFSLLGHKGDLMFLHFRESFDDLNRAELQLSQLRLSEYWEPTTSYLSIIELGLYDSTTKIYLSLIHISEPTRH